MVGEPRRLAIFFSDFRCGGVERMRTLMSAEFLEHGLAVDLVVLNTEGDLLATVPTGVRVVSLGVQRIRHALAPLVRYLQTNKPDVLLADTWPLTSIAVVAGRIVLHPVRVVVVDHTILSRSPLFQRPSSRLAVRSTIRMTYPSADSRIAVSHGVADDLSKIGHLSRSSISVIHNAAATGLVDGRGKTPAWTKWTAGPRILTVGSLKEQKDHATLLRAFATLRRAGPAHLAILGDGPLRDQTEALARELGVADDVDMPGFVDDVASWYADADIFALSSWVEGFGNVIVEALEHGVPVVSTDCPSGPREILEDGRYGTLVPVGNAPALAAAIQASLHAPQDRELLRERAKDFLVAEVTQRYIDAIFPGM